MPGITFNSPGMPAARPAPAVPRGAAAINASARAKTAADQAAMAQKAQTAQTVQQTGNIAPSVQALVGRTPVSQGAYEQQAQTQLQGNIAGQHQQAEIGAHAQEAAANRGHELTTLEKQQTFQGGQADLNRTHETQTQQQSIQARQAEQKAEIEARHLEQQAAEAAKRGEMELSAQLSKDAETRRLSFISNFKMPGMVGEGPASGAPETMGAPAGGGEAMGAPAGQGRPAVGAPGAPGAPAANPEEAARTAAFARAKDRAGQTAAASIKSLQDVMAGQGKMGSSMEAGGVASLIGDAGSEINDFTRDEMMLDLNRASDISDRNYQGAIAQRGQNMGMQQSLLSLLKGGGAY